MSAPQPADVETDRERMEREIEAMPDCFRQNIGRIHWRGDEQLRRVLSFYRPAVQRYRQEQEQELQQ